MTLTPEKLEANRRNAAMSTGPVTAEGKTRSSANATKSGWFTRDLHVHPSEQDAWTAFCRKWLDSLQPEGPLEDEFFQDFLRALWRKHQIRDAQNSVASAAAHPNVFLDQDAKANLDRLVRYEAQFERRAQRALNELKRLQTARALQPPASPEDADAEACPTPPLADPAAIAAAKNRTHSAAAAAAIPPDLRRTLAIIEADARHLAARARAFAAGIPVTEMGSAVAAAS